MPQFNLKTGVQIENNILKELVTSSLHLLIKTKTITDQEIQECDSYKEMKDLIETKTLLLIKEEREKKEKEEMEYEAWNYGIDKDENL